jgi:hypothetical protein
MGIEWGYHGVQEENHGIFGIYGMYMEYIYMEYIWNIWTYPLEICYSLLLKMTIENVDLPSGKW